jgi:hypothetical protein
VRLRAATLLALAVAIGIATPASATSSQEAVDFLNQQRGANGIPASVTMDPYRTKGCKSHNHYMALNGIQHGEQQGMPGYTPEGADYTNSGEVVAQGVSGWTASSNPWDAAPLHQSILFDPRIGASGYDESENFACMRLQFVFSNPAQPSLYAYTGNLGRTNVPPREVVCCEGPYAPQEAVGIDQGVPTGPNILFFTQGFGNTNHALPGSFSLTGPAGPVEVKFVDSTTPPPPKGGGYKAFQTGGDMIPVQPLGGFTDYTASVTWVNDDNAEQMQQSVKFTTGGFERGLTLTLSKNLAKGRKATLKAPAEAVGQKATVKIGLLRKGKKKPQTVSSKSITLKQSQKIAVPRPSKGGRTVVTVTLPPFTLGDTRFSTPTVKRSYR